MPPTRQIPAANHGFTRPRIRQPEQRWRSAWRARPATTTLRRQRNTPSAWTSSTRSSAHCRVAAKARPKSFRSFARRISWICQTTSIRRTKIKTRTRRPSSSPSPSSSRRSLLRISTQPVTWSWFTGLSTRRLPFPVPIWRSRTTARSFFLPIPVPRPGRSARCFSTITTPAGRGKSPATRASRFGRRTMRTSPT